MDCKMKLLRTGAANTCIADSYNEDISYAPRPSSIPQQRMYAIVPAFGCVAVDSGGRQCARADVDIGKETGLLQQFDVRRALSWRKAVVGDDEPFQNLLIAPIRLSTRSMPLRQRGGRELHAIPCFTQNARIALLINAGLPLICSDAPCCKIQRMVNESCACSCERLVTGSNSPYGDLLSSMSNPSRAFMDVCDAIISP
jgi:hypothetical protein